MMNKLETLRSFQEVLKRKLAAIKTLKDEIISIIDNPAEIEQIITESMTLEIQSKAQLNLMKKHLNNSLKLENDVGTSTWKDTVKLPKPNSMEIQQSSSLLSTYLKQPLNRLIL